MKVNHTLAPIYNKDSKILILGTIPSVKSREENFYYAHPRNRFWKILSIIYKEEIGQSSEEKKEFLLKHHIALFDVLKSCEIKASSDSTISKPEPNDIKEILKKSKIKKIYTTGKKAYELYNKYCLNETHIEAVYLPSTSPANCQKSFEEIIKEYEKIKEI